MLLIGDCCRSVAGFCKMAAKVRGHSKNFGRSNTVDVGGDRLQTLGIHIDLQQSSGQEQRLPVFVQMAGHRTSH